MTDTRDTSDTTDISSLIGRDEINDLEAILAVSNTDVDAKDHKVDAKVDSIFTWDYERSRPALSKLYEKAKTSQWNASTDLDWSTPVDIEQVVMNNQAANGEMFFGNVDLTGTPFAKWDEKKWLELGIEGNRWTMSQFLHGEQGALICTGRIVETVPWIDAKYYAATQVVDEARHVEVFSRYIDEKLEGGYPINAHLRDAARRHHHRRAVGHDLPRHADHGRGPRARGVRLHAPDDHGAAAEEAAPLRHERRGAPRCVRCALAAGVLHAAVPAPRSASARSSRSRPRCACAIASCSRRCGTAWAST